MELAPDTLLQAGKYKITNKIGQGGFGIAYLAYHQSLKNDVCIKEFFFSDLCERAQNSLDVTIITKSVEKLSLVNSFKKKFTKEAQRLAKFQHPNIVQVTNTFEENNTAYFVMEYLQGGSLEDLLSREGALSEQKTKELILPLIDALDAIHKTDLLHLDIKPANIMLRNNQTPVLIDFGISKYMELAGGVTTTAPVGISKGYAPLEQYGGSISDFSKATDVYSLCATMYKMVTGQIPPEPLQILGKGLKKPKDINPDLSDGISRLIVKGLSTRLEERHQNAIELLEEIKTSKNDGKNSTAFNIKETEIDGRVFNKLSKYNDTGSFSDSLAAVKLNDLWGFIDKNGNEVIPCKYEHAWNFDEGLAAVKKNSKWGWIDKNGNEIIPCKYDSFSGFIEGFSSIKLYNHWGFIDQNGNEVIPCKYDKTWFFEEGIAKVNINNKWGLIDKNGNGIVSCKYDEIDGFREGLALVKSSFKYGFIDKKGNEVIPCQYDFGQSFSEGLASVATKDGKYNGWIDKIGELVIPFRKYEFAGSFYDGLARIEKRGLFKSKMGFIDKKGNEAIPCKYDDVRDFINGFAEAKNGELIGYIDKNGEFLYGGLFSELGSFAKGYAIVKSAHHDYGIHSASIAYGSAYGIINRKREILLSFKYEHINDFSEDGLASVKESILHSNNGKWGYVNKFWQEVIPCKFDEAWFFSEGLAKVKLNGKICFIDKQGNTVLE